MPALRVALHHHPDTPCAAVERIDVEVVHAPGSLTLHFVLAGTIAGLRIPTRVDPDRLWAHTCCEAFVARPGADGYEEWNLSPSGQHAHYDFSAYRVRAADPGVGPLALRCDHDAHALRLSAQLPTGDAPRMIALACVVEATDGALSYWSLHHRAGRPDFHHRDTFVLTLQSHAITLAPA